MSYGHISLGLGAVVLILAGGFIAIILIDLLFDYFDGLTKWLAARQQEGIQHVRIDRETARALAQLARQQERRSRVGSVVAPTGTMRNPHRVSRGQPTVANQQAAQRIRAIQPAPVTGGPGRGDPPKGVAH